MVRAGVEMRRIIPFLLMVLLSFSCVEATITVTASPATPSVTVGSDLPITASFVVGSGDSGVFYLSCDQSSFTVNPESYTISSSTTKVYTFTPNEAITYTNCKVTDFGTQSSSPFSINVIQPAILTVTGSPSQTSSSSFILTISITNPTSSAVTTSYSLNCSSVGTCSGDGLSATISLDAGSTTTLTWQVSAESSGTINFQLGNNPNAFITTVSLPSSTTVPVTEGGGGAAAGVSIRGNVFKKVFSSILPAIPKTIASVDLRELTGITSLQIKVKNRVTNVKISFERLEELPEDIPKPTGKSYRFLRIEVENAEEEDFEEVVIEFEVEKEWVEKNGIDVKSIRLYRYTNAWVELDTELVDEDDNYYYFRALSPALSYFAIMAEKEEEEVTTTTAAPETGTTVPTSTTTTKIEEKVEEVEVGREVWLGMVFLMIACGIFLLIIFMKFYKKLPRLK